MNKKEVDQVVTKITDFINTYSLDSDAFCESMSREHRTLQQSFTRLCLKWIEHCASANYRTDGRNEDSHTISKTILDSFKKVMCTDSRYEHMDFSPSNYLPMI